MGGGGGLTGLTSGTSAANAAEETTAKAAAESAAIAAGQVRLVAQIRRFNGASAAYVSTEFIVDLHT
jgi:hypothetical protein